MMPSKTTIPDSFYWPVLINNNIGSKRAYSLGRLKSALRRPRYNRLEGQYTERSTLQVGRRISEKCLWGGDWALGSRFR
jgi:hypothetical protein